MRGRWSEQFTDADYIARWRSQCIESESGCWLWQGFCHTFRGIKPGQRGYPSSSYRSTNVRVHRKVLELKIGRLLSRGEVACHTCDTPHCINPDHLFAGTQKDNIRDGIAKGHQQFHPSHYTHCKHGHEFTPENTWVCKQGYRHCRACQRATCRRRYYKDVDATRARMNAYRKQRKAQLNGQNGEG